MAENYFDCLKNEFTQEHKNGIMNMYNSIKYYDFNEIFNMNNSIYIRESRKCFTLSSILDNTNTNSWKGTIISDNNKSIFKLTTYKNIENSVLLTVHLLREVYFQNTFRTIIKRNNINDIIVPEIYRYGIVNIHNKLIFFFEMAYYKDIYHNFRDLLIEPNNIQHNSCLMISYLNKLKSYRKVINDLEETNKLYHNDIPSLRQISNLINDIENNCRNNNAKRITKKINIVDFTDMNMFLFKNYDKCLLIDFEKSFLFDISKTTYEIRQNISNCLHMIYDK